MNGSQILRDKHAVVFGAGGSIGAAVAKEFAAEGEEVFLSGRTKSNLEAVAKRIGEHGVRTQAALIDTLNDSAVNEYFDGIVKRSGKIDIILDAAGPLAKDYGNGKNAVDLPVEEFMVPLATIVRSRFVTARAAARHMIKQHSGVIILVTGSPARAHVPGAIANWRCIWRNRESRGKSRFRGQSVRCQGSLHSNSRQCRQQVHPGHDGLSGGPTADHKGPGDCANRAVQLSEGSGDHPGYCECSGPDRFRACAHANWDGRKRHCRRCARLTEKSKRLADRIDSCIHRSTSCQGQEKCPTACSSNVYSSE